MKLPENIKVLIITLSDRASKGEYDDKSGPTIKEYIDNHFSQGTWKYETETKLISDSAVKLKKIIKKDKKEYNIIFTTGGTGIGPSDITVDVIKPMLDKEIPGIMEVIRVKYGMQKPNAMLSRGVAGVIGISLIYTLPGSVKAVKEYMTEIITTLEHLVYMQYGVDVHKKKAPPCLPAGRLASPKGRNSKTEHYKAFTLCQEIKDIK